GMALGGGCEFVMHSQRAVAALESYIGLVEVGVGLLPAGGGLKDLAQRVAAWARGGDAFPELQRVFKQVAMGETSTSALDARERGYLRDSDVVVFHPAELLYVAKQQARAMAESGVRPAVPNPEDSGAGRSGNPAPQNAAGDNEGGPFLPEHDYDISARVAE